MARVGEICCVGHCGENSAGKGAGLRLEHCLACGAEGSLKFSSKATVDLGVLVRC